MLFLLLDMATSVLVEEPRHKRTYIKPRPGAGFFVYRHLGLSVLTFTLLYNNSYLLEGAMKKILLIALLLIVGCSKPVNESTLLKRGELMYEANATKPFSGKVFELYDNGQKAFEGTYKNGFMQGDWTYYTETSNGKYNVTYTAGTYNLVVFTDNLGTNYTGYPVTEDPEQDGIYLFQKDGHNKYDFSKIPIGCFTVKDGELDGLVTSWYEN